MYLEECFVTHEKGFFKLKYTFVHDIMNLLIIFDKEIKNLKVLASSMNNKMNFTIFQHVKKHLCFVKEVLSNA